MVRSYLYFILLSCGIVRCKRALRYVESMLFGFITRVYFCKNILSVCIISKYNNNMFHCNIGKLVTYLFHSHVSIVLNLFTKYGCPSLCSFDVTRKSSCSNGYIFFFTLSEMVFQNNAWICMLILHLEDAWIYCLR